MTTSSTAHNDIPDTVSLHVSLDHVYANIHSIDNIYDNQDVVNNTRNVGILDDGDALYQNVQQAKHEMANHGASDIEDDFEKVSTINNTKQHDPELIDSPGDVYDMPQKVHKAKTCPSVSDETEIVENEIYEISNQARKDTNAGHGEGDERDIVENELYHT